MWVYGKWIEKRGENNRQHGYDLRDYGALVELVGHAEGGNETVKEAMALTSCFGFEFGQGLVQEALVFVPRF